MTRTKKDLINALMKIKKELKLIKGKQKNRKTFIPLEEAEKIVRKVATYIEKDFRGTEHIQCKLYLPACYANKSVIVKVAKGQLNEGESK